MTTTVKIEPSESIYIERLFYELNAGRSTLAFLMKQKSINEEALQHYIDVIETRTVELEKAKEELSKKYEPKEFFGTRYNYTFDFDNESIIYTDNVTGGCA